MSVLKRELNFSSFQEQQLGALKAINKSLDINVDISRSLAANIEKSTKANESSAKNIYAIAKKMGAEATKFTESTQKAAGSAKKLGDSLDKTAKSSKKNAEGLDKSGSKVVSALGSLATGIWKELGSLRGIGQEVNKYSHISNDMITMTGMSGAAVKQFRSDLMGTVKELNLVTGMYFNGAQAYSQMLSISQGVTSNLDAIQEMSRPLLLAQETLDANTSTIADLFNRFYTRYNFSSQNMEDTLDQIRGNTAGNSANAEATLANIKSLEHWIGIVSGNDNQKRENMLAEISNYTSWIESMGGDSAYYTEMLNAIAYGDYSSHPELANILNRGGLSSLEATNMAKDGQFEEVTQALMLGLDSIYKTISGSAAIGASIDHMGAPRDAVMDAHQMMEAANYIGLDEFIETSNKTSTKMVDLVEDKYVSFQDKVTNLLSGIYEKLAGVQETLGFGFSDLALAFMLAGNMFKGSGSGGVGNFIKGSYGHKWANQYGRGFKQGKGALGLLEMGGYNASGGSLVGGKAAALGGLTAGGALAGAGIAIDGIVGLTDKEADTTSKVASGVEVAAGATAAGALGASLFGAGAAAGPIGWAALAIAGAALAFKKVHEAVTPVSGLAKDISKEMKNMKKSFIEEQAARASALTSLELSIQASQDNAEAIRLAVDAGLIPLEEATSHTKDSLLELAEAAHKAAIETGDEASFIFDTVETILSGAAKDETSEFNKSLYEGIVGEYGSHVRQKDSPVEYAKLETVFTKMAEAISDTSQREKSMKMVQEVFADGWLTGDEIRLLTDQKWGWRATGGIGSKVRLKNISSRHWDAEGYTQAVEAAEGLGIDTGYTAAEAQGAVNTMMQAYSAWSNFSATAEQKKSALTEFTEAWKSIPEDYSQKQALRESLSTIAEKMGVTPFAVGTNYVSHDQLAIVHEGEAIVPKKYNPAVNNEDLRYVADQMKATQLEARAEAQASREYLASFIDEIKEIRAFLSEWKTDNNRRETASALANKHAVGKTLVQNYLAL